MCMLNHWALVCALWSTISKLTHLRIHLLLWQLYSILYITTACKSPVSTGRQTLKNSPTFPLLKTERWLSQGILKIKRLCVSFWAACPALPSATPPPTGRSSGSPGQRPRQAGREHPRAVGDEQDWAGLDLRQGTPPPSPAPHRALTQFRITECTTAHTCVTREWRRHVSRAHFSRATHSELCECAKKRCFRGQRFTVRVFNSPHNNTKRP